MKDAIIAKLKAKFPKLSDARIAAYAAKLESKVKDEKEIDDKIAEYDEVIDFASIIKQDAKVAKLEAEKKESKKTTVPAKQEDEEGSDEEESTEVLKKEPRVPSYVKKMMEKLETLGTELSTIKSEKSKSTIQQKAADLLKDIPASYWGEWKQPDSEDGLEEFVTKVTSGCEGFTQDLADRGFSTMSKPKGGAGGAGGGDVKKASDAEVKSVLAKL